MRWFLIALVACGASPPPAEPLPPAIGRAISIQWKAAATDGDEVLVSIVVDGKSIDLGPLNAVDDMQRGPRTCALRAAHPLRTELTCGDLTSYYAAELQGAEELVITLVEPAGQREIRRIPVYGEGLAVQPYALPDAGE